MTIRRLRALYVFYLIDLCQKAETEEARRGFYDRIERAIASQEVPVVLKPEVWTVPAL